MNVTYHKAQVKYLLKKGMVEQALSYYYLEPYDSEEYNLAPDNAKEVHDYLIKSIKRMVEVYYGND